MNRSHAAALALVGWYLMIPVPGYWNDPLSKWSHFDSYDTATECASVQRRMIEKTSRPDWDPGAGKFSAADLHRSFAHSECISTDDPRLKDR
jgi:hypothetical protein